MSMLLNCLPARDQLLPQVLQEAVVHAREEQSALLVREDVLRRVVQLVELLAERLSDGILGIQGLLKLWVLGCVNSYPRPEGRFLVISLGSFTGRVHFEDIKCTVKCRCNIM